MALLTVSRELIGDVVRIAGCIVIIVVAAIAGIGRVVVIAVVAGRTVFGNVCMGSV